MEIERKFLVRELPENLNLFVGYDIEQGYLPEKEKGIEERIRRKGDRYYFTVKGSGDLSREEKEKEISEKDFLYFWKMTKGRIEKTRYEFPFNGHLVEIDVYSGNLEGLVVAEVEFNSEQEAGRFTAPEWLGKEVTSDERYKNKNLAKFGIPN